MRITNAMMMNNLLRDLHKNNRLMEGSNRRLSTGKDFHLPGENPIGTSKSMNLYTGLNTNSKFIENMHEGIAWLEYTDDALGDTTNILIRARELTVYGANDIHDETSRLGIAEEIDALKDAIHEISNSSYAGRYIFSGEKTDTKPYLSDGTFKGNDNFFRVEVGPGSYMEVNLPGSHVFGKNESVLKYSEDSIVGVLEMISRDLRGDGEVKNLKMEKDPGLSLLEVEDLQEGSYNLSFETINVQDSRGSIVREEQNHLRAPGRPSQFFQGALGATSTKNEDPPEDNSPYNGSLEIEVLEVHEASHTLTAQLKGHFYDDEGMYYHLDEEITLNMDASENEAIFQIDKESLNGEDDLLFYSTRDLEGVFDGDGLLQYQRGDKVSLNLSAEIQSDTDYKEIEVTYQPKESSSNMVTHTYLFKAEEFEENIEDEDFHLQFITLIEGQGKSHHGKLELEFEEMKDGELSFTYKKGRVGDRIQNLDDRIETLLINRASLGGKVHRLELNKNYLTDHELRLKDLLSKNEDADIASTIIDLKIQETIHRSALASGARMIQPSLLDFLR